MLQLLESLIHIRSFDLLLITITLFAFLSAPSVSVLVNAQSQSNLKTLRRNQVSFTHQHEIIPQPGHLLSEEALHYASRASIDNHFLPTTTLQSDPGLGLNLKLRPTAVYRPRSLDAFHEARLANKARHTGRDRTGIKSEIGARVRKDNAGGSDGLDEVDVSWDIIHLDGPDVRDINTLAQLARMSGNAYVLGPSGKNWYELDGAWNISFPFGYEDAQDGFRGHVFLSSDNSTIVLAIKGTTLQGPTSKKDKFNDNLLFSCCCARVDFSWIFHQVCDCYSGSWKCDNTCLSNALVEDSMFYTIGVNLVNDLRTLYPNANLWLVGHSLGGALASLLGSTFGLPAIAFESPGERLAAERLGLPMPPAPIGPTESQMSSSGENSIIPSLSPVVHVYHTADPIPQGTCTGPFSPCSQAGYALETHCHLGKSIVFDTVTEFGWRVDIRRHPIREVVGVMETWGQEEASEEDDEEEYWRNANDMEERKSRSNSGKRRRSRQVPEAKEEIDCVDCFKWEFGSEFKDKGFEASACGS
ncbi:Alpha/Beta hydrolase protein [Lentinula edodes]|uniref:triacylglycerol lipase n=1 Tax=Lentinula lateritia TaxID=40482 RepID=A0A9W9DPV7_9AGAR|nr:Alpha/Beta hydrolase protein [Lentinula edodes]